MDASTFYGVRTTRVTTVAEVHDYIQEKSRKIRNVVVLPPAAGDRGDQESDLEDAVEDGEGEYKPAGELEIEESDSDIEQPDNSPPRKRRTNPGNKWTISATIEKPLKSEEPMISEYFVDELETSPIEIWNKIFSTDIVMMLVHQTNLYANRDQNNQKFEVDKREMLRFLGILLLSGYHTLPHENHYWSTQQDLGVSIVYNAMSRNRYHEIKKYFHCADNQNLIPGDKMSKVTPLYEKLNKNLITFGIHHKLLSVDESMVPYYGRHSAKMFIKCKPIRFCYKV